MSRVGKLPIAVPAGVEVQIVDSSVKVRGPKGELTENMPRLVGVALDEGNVQVTRANDSKIARANHGLMRALVQNMVTGVSKGFSKTLQVVGVGYRADMKGSKLVMQLGYSHPIEFQVPAGITITVDKKNNIVIDGADKRAVGQAAAVIRDFRRPDAYKGKGVRYQDETIRLKQGKSA